MPKKLTTEEFIKKAKNIYGEKHDYSLVEYQGRQHYEDCKYFNYPLKYIQKHDNIKREYCLKNSIKLIEIPYQKSVNKILKEKLL